MRLALALSLLAMLLPVAAAGSTNKARVGFVTVSPVSVRGTGFKPGERVMVTVSATVTRKKAVNANARGAFRATFSHFWIVRCQAYTVAAKGNRGSTASLRVIPECAPPPPPDPPDPLPPNDPLPKKHPTA